VNVAPWVVVEILSSAENLPEHSSVFATNSKSEFAR
jgi:hypothetical protein